MEKIVGNFDEIKQEVKKEVRESLSELVKDVDEVKVAMSQMLEKLNAFQLIDKLQIPGGGILNEHRDDILIAGGYGMEDEPSEIYSWVRNGWFNVSPMNKEVLILGGQKSESCQSAVDSVFVFDIEKNEWKEMPLLPHPVTRMATVCWKDQVVVLGGLNKNEDALNDVFMYDCKTGKITTLPFMLEKRYDCCAVITGSTIVVMGGVNDDSDELDSVECFTMGGSEWEYLPDMNSS